MATKTEKYGLTKPDENDYYDIAVFNENMDIIEKGMKGHEENKRNPHGVTAEQIGAFGFIKALPANTDLNTILQMGTYYVTATSAATLVNAPLNAAGHYYVFCGDDSGSRIIQVFTRTNPTASNGGKLYYRVISITDGWFSEWMEISKNITAGTTDITAGTSALATDDIYQVYK